MCDQLFKKHFENYSTISYCNLFLNDWNANIITKMNF